jgi:hypothetical protein
VAVNGAEAGWQWKLTVTAVPYQPAALLCRELVTRAVIVGSDRAFDTDDVRKFPSPEYVADTAREAPAGVV